MKAITKQQRASARLRYHGSTPNLLAQLSEPNSSNIFFNRATSELLESGACATLDKQWLVSMVRSISAASTLTRWLAVENCAASAQSLADALYYTDPTCPASDSHSDENARCNQADCTRLSAPPAEPSGARRLAVYPGDAAAILVSLQTNSCR